MTNALSWTTDNLTPTRYSLLSRLENWDDHESWHEFFETYWRLIYSVALKSGLTESESQDAVQETIISVAKDLQKFKRERQLGSFKAWLLNVTRWRIADQFRKRTQALSRDGGELDDAADGSPMGELASPIPPELERHWDQEWRTNLLEAAMANIRRRVKEEHYQIFDLYVVKQWPVVKIAATLGVSVGQVYLAKHRVSVLVKRRSNFWSGNGASFIRSRLRPHLVSV